MPDKPLVLITDPIHPKAIAQLREHCDVLIASDAAPRSLQQLMRGAHGLIVRSQLPADVFDDAPLIRAVVRHGVGVDMIPMQVATRRRIPVANLPGSNTTAVVEYCVAAMLHLRRRLYQIDASLRTDGWDPARPIANRLGELSGGVCGIVGVGAIGTRLAAVCAGLGMRVIGLTRRPETLPPGVRAVGKQELFETSDVVILCCPLNEQTRGFVESRAIAAMKHSAILINVARGPVIDTSALLAALREDRIAGAALDVHEVQPIPAGDPLLEAPNLLLTPHVAGITNHSLRAMSLGAATAMLALLRGERGPNIVNPEIFD